MMSNDFLPNCRTREPGRIIQTKQGTWIPIFCANCGKPGGAVPEENTTFAFYLCNSCVEQHGPIAATMMVKDEEFWTEIAAEREAKRRKEGRT